MKTIALLTLIACASMAVAAEPKLGGLPRGVPEAEGVSSAALLDFVQAADASIDAMNSLMVVRHGRVVAEGWWAPYSAESPHSLYSLSKSFTSTAVGLAVAEGKLSVDDEVLKFFPDDAPTNPGNNLKAMRVSDLLRMNTGHQSEPPVQANPDRTWAATFLAQPVPFKPGTHFLYNTSATYMLSAIVQKTTGATVLDYLRPRLFEPLGIENPTWGTSPQGVSLGGYGLSVRTEDIAKFGQLYLQKGKWNGRQIVPESWVAAATARQTSNGSSPKSDWDQGYGYQFWRCRHGAYRGDGAFGQYCVVLPEQDAVIAITSGVKDMQSVLNLVWERLLPAFKESALPADDAARKRLEDRLAALQLPVVAGSGGPGSSVKVAGKRFRFPPNDRKLETLSIETDPEGASTTLVIHAGSDEQRIVCPRGSWQKARAALANFADQPAATCGAWTADDTFTAKVCFYETPFLLTLRLRIEGDRLSLEGETNVGFGASRQPTLEARAD